MDTIVTPVTVITLDSTRIVHSIKADLVARYFPPVVRLVQYDMSLPVIAVSLMQNGQTYTLPSGAAANIRVHKPDATYVYNPALGCDSTRNIVYFEVTQAMAAANGDGLAIVEIVVDGDIAGTSLITLHFEENPVPEDAIESSDEWETIYELGERIIASTVTPVSTAAGMTDHDVVYLYTGTESGWNQGHMYYYNGTTWVDAGIAVTDTTLSVAGLAADAKKTGDEIADLKDGLSDLEASMTENINNVYVTDTASGAIASFQDGADNVPVKSLAVDIEPVQDLHGQANPYPAGGGKNILPVTLSGLKTINTSGTWSGNAYTVRGVTYTVQTDSGNNVTGINVNGTATGGAAYFRLVPNTFDVASENILNGCPSGQSYETCSITVYASNDSTVIGYDAGNGLTFNSASDNVNVYIRVASGTAVSNKVFKPMIRTSSSVDATYAPYENICPISGHTSAVVTVSPTTDAQDGTSYTIDLDGTRYGGTLDATTGVLTVDRVAYTFTNGTGLTEGTDGNVDWLCVKHQISSDLWNINTRTQNICSHAPFTFANVNGNPHFYTTRNIFQLFVPKSVYASLSAFTSSLATNPLTFVTMLSNPQTYQLTANELKTVLGQNNIWNDCGDTTVEYRADTKLYIQKVLNG